MSDKQKGPSVKIDLSCFDCGHCKTKGYACQSDSGSDVYCDASGVLRHIGDTSWRTPAWCPCLTESMRLAISTVAEMIPGKLKTEEINHAR